MATSRVIRTFHTGVTGAVPAWARTLPVRPSSWLLDAVTFHSLADRASGALVDGLALPRPFMVAEPPALPFSVADALERAPHELGYTLHHPDTRLVGELDRFAAVDGMWHDAVLAAASSGLVLGATDLCPALDLAVRSSALLVRHPSLLVAWVHALGPRGVWLAGHNESWRPFTADERSALGVALQVITAAGVRPGGPVDIPRFVAVWVDVVGVRPADQREELIPLLRLAPRHPEVLASVRHVAGVDGSVKVRSAAMAHLWAFDAEWRAEAMAALAGTIDFSPREVARGRRDADAWWAAHAAKAPTTASQMAEWLPLGLLDALARATADGTPGPARLRADEVLVTDRGPWEREPHRYQRAPSGRWRAGAVAAVAALAEPSRHLFQIAAAPLVTDDGLAALAALRTSSHRPFVPVTARLITLRFEWRRHLAQVLGAAAPRSPFEPTATDLPE